MDAMRASGLLEWTRVDPVNETRLQKVIYMRLVVRHAHHLGFITVLLVWRMNQIQSCFRERGLRRKVGKARTPRTLCEI